jgi:hypothetical protein
VCFIIILHENSIEELIKKPFGKNTILELLYHKNIACLGPDLVSFVNSVAHHPNNLFAGA